MMTSEQRRRNWKRFFITTGLGGLMVPAILLCIERRPTLVHLAQNYIYGMVFTVSVGSVMGLVMPRLWVLCERTALKKLKWACILSGMLFAAVIGTFVGCGFFILVGLIQPERFWEQFEISVRFSIVITMILGGGVLGYEVMRERLERTTLELRTQQLERERALKLATEARLSSLESRIHPHFLFNTINSVSALIREDPAKAERVLEQMAALLRFSLDSAHIGIVPLARELKIVNDYLEIERVRFGHRLRYTLDVPQDLQDIEVPPLSLQTLVENSVKYAISPRREGGEVRIEARSEAERVYVRVSDDGPGFDISDMKAGHGLDILQGRMLAQFGTDAAVNFRRSDNGMEVLLFLPARAGVAS